MIYGVFSINFDYYYYLPGRMRTLLSQKSCECYDFLFTFLSPLADGELLKTGTLSEVFLATATKGPLERVQIIQ